MGMWARVRSAEDREGAGDGRSGGGGGYSIAGIARPCRSGDSEEDTGETWRCSTARTGNGAG